MTAVLDHAPSIPAPRHAAPQTATKTRRGRHRATPSGVDVSTQQMPVVRPKEGGPVPFPEQAGQVIRHPKTGAIAVACNAWESNSPKADQVPCYAIVRGAELHRDWTGRAPLWLTYNEVIHNGWRLDGHTLQ